jgi:hypothetical protein
LRALEKPVVNCLSCGKVQSPLPTLLNTHSVHMELEDSVSQPAWHSALRLTLRLAN